MSDTKKTTKKVAAPKKPADHPKYLDMITVAIQSLKERNGSSRQAIAKYIKANYKVMDNCDVHIKQALKRGVLGETLHQVKGTGASGSFKVIKKTEPKKKAPKKTVAKKPAAATASSKKKPAAKKKANNNTTPKKGTKKTTKKSGSAKKGTKKPVKKATAKKPAAKKVAKKNSTTPKKKNTTKK